MIKLKDILKEVDMGPISSKCEKTIIVKHKTSGKTLVVVDTPASRKKYTRMGYIIPLPKHLQKIIKSLEQTSGVVKPVDENSEQLKKYLESECVYESS